MDKFIHLHVHSHYSLSNGLNDLDEIMQCAKKQNFTSIALTDQSNLFAMVKFYQAAHKSSIKPILGCHVQIYKEKIESSVGFIFLCKNKQGLNYLMQLISRAYENNSRDDLPKIDFDWLDYTRAKNLIGIYCHNNFKVAKNNKYIEEQKQYFKELKDIFINSFYFEINLLTSEDTAIVHKTAKLSREYAVPLVASNAVYFLEKEDFIAHEARVCISNGQYLADKNRVSEYTSEQYLKSSEQMCGLFARYPSALQNSVEISKRCNVYLNLGKAYLPKYSVPKGFSSSTYLEKIAHDGLIERLKVLQKKTDEDYKQRLMTELVVINKMNYSGYFLIVADFIAWAKKQGIPVGPGRGSGAGSLVAFALGITDLDPLSYNLLFERFLNPERISMPDFDIDFCMERRDLVIDYVANKYGRRSVSQIITFGTMAAKAVIRDVGRVLGMPYGFVDSVAKLIPNELGITLKKALDDEPLLQEKFKNDEEVKNLMNLAFKLEGKVRNAGKHAGGVVISPSLLTDFTAFYCDPGGGNLVSQLDKDDVEKVGLVKFDFLGLRTLTIIDWACSNIEKLHNKKINISELNLRCMKTFNLIKACKTTAVFQLESRGMKELIGRLKPGAFEEIIALVALFRPGPLQSGMVDDFINRKHGRESIEYPHPCLSEILSPTYGVILYQEQVMQIAQVLSGYTLGGADILRRAMGKKKPEEMEKQRSIFIQGAIDNQVSDVVAGNIFDLIEKFAGYGFNKSHSAAYALISYQTAWLKTHYPAEFMAAVLSADMDNTVKLVGLLEASVDIGLTVFPPDINESFYRFTPLDSKRIRFGLGAIKGVGGAAIEEVLNSRKEGGVFSSFWDFCHRVEVRKINRRVLESLIKSGTFDSLTKTRAALLEQLEETLSSVVQANKNLQLGQVDLFAVSANVLPPSIKNSQIVELSKSILLKGEKETLGYYLSGHPFDCYKQEFAKLTSGLIKDLQLSKGNAYKVAGILQSIRRIKTKAGQIMAIIILEDSNSRLELALFPSVYEEFISCLVIEKPVILCCEAVFDRFKSAIALQVKKVLTLERARVEFAKKLVLEMNGEKIKQFHIVNLKEYLDSAAKGACWVELIYINVALGAKVVLNSKRWKIRATKELLDKVNAGVPSVEAKLFY